jgi:iron complex transport system ATP-binding protein
MNKEYFFYTKKLTVGYNGKPLIKDIEVNLKKGQILTLIGPNGSGKSTILKSITKHLKSICGTIYIDSESIESMSNKDMAQKVSVMLTDKLKTEL